LLATLTPENILINVISIDILDITNFFQVRHPTPIGVKHPVEDLTSFIRVMVVPILAVRFSDPDLIARHRSIQQSDIYVNRASSYLIVAVFSIRFVLFKSL
jgi:hypothetical protein